MNDKNVTQRSNEVNGTVNGDKVNKFRYIEIPDEDDADDPFGFLESSLKKSESNFKLSQILKEWGTQVGGLTSRKFDAKNPPPPVIPVYTLNGHTICTPGNLTVIAAHDKAGKSGLVGSFIAASFGREGDCLGIKSGNPEELAVIHFDTEQSPGDHFARVMKALHGWDLTRHRPGSGAITCSTLTGANGLNSWNAN